MMSRCVIHIYIKYTCIYYIKTHEKSNSNRNSPSFLPTPSYHILSFLPSFLSPSPSSPNLLLSTPYLLFFKSFSLFSSNSLISYPLFPAFLFSPIFSLFILSTSYTQIAKESVITESFIAESFIA